MNDPIKYPAMRWLVLLAGGLAVLAGNMYIISFASILPDIAADLGINIGTATNFMSVFMLVASIAIIVGGLLCDRFGILFVLMLSALFASGGALLMPLMGHQFQTALVARIFEGIGTGFAFCLMSPIMATWFPPKEQGIAAGLLGTATALGAVVGYPLSSGIFKATGSWQEMSAWISIVGWVPFVLAIVLMMLPKPDLPSQARADEPSGTDGLFRQQLAEPMTWICTLVTFFAAWQLQTLYNITPTYLAAVTPQGLGLGYMGASKLMLGASIAGVLAPIISGIIQDKVFKTKARPFMFIGFVLCCVCMYLLLLPAVSGSTHLILVCLIFAAAGVAVLYAAIPLFASLNYPIQVLGKVFGIIFGLGAFGGAVGLFVAGAAFDARGNYHLAITLISLAALVGFLCVLGLRRWRGEGA
jgi:MFS family permease